jgi:hypothetical protein
MTAEPEDDFCFLTADEVRSLKLRTSQMSQSELNEYAIDWASCFLWSRGIGMRTPIPAGVQRIAQEYGVDPHHIPCPLPVGSRPEGRELVCKYHDLLISNARLGSDHAARVLCDFASAPTTQGDPPPWLLKHLVSLVSREQQFLASREQVPAKAASKRGRRGRDPYSNEERDLFIGFAVRSVVEGFGYRPTRNVGTAQKRPRDERGCSIVCKALQRIGVHMTEWNVASIWRRTKRGTQSQVDRPVIIGSTS